MVGFGGVKRVLMQPQGAGLGVIYPATTFSTLSHFLTPNVTTPYLSSWLNLAETGPYIIEIEAKALDDRDVAAGVLMVKIAERRATLLGLNPPIGHAVAIVHAPQHHEQQPDVIDRMTEVLDRIAASRRKTADPDGNDRGDLH